MERLFYLRAKKTSVKTEIVAGITTFLSMAYILAVNPLILSDAGMNQNSVFLATAIASGVSCILMGFISNYPIALSASMGVSAFFTYTIVEKMGYNWMTALCAVFASGILFVLISITGLRQFIINAIPVPLKNAIGAGIGFFIAFIGLINAGIVVSDTHYYATIGNLSDPTVLLAIFGLAVTIVLVIRKVPAAIFIGMLVTIVTGIILGLMGIKGMPSLPSSLFTQDYNMAGIGAFVAGFNELSQKPMDTAIILFSLVFLDFFDTAGSLISIGNIIGIVNENGELENGEKVLIADALGTVLGACLGTSTITSYPESTLGVKVGGRTGLTAIVTGICFILSIFISPLILSTVTYAVTAPAMVVVGITMAQQFKDLDWSDTAIAASTFVVVLTMVLMNSISQGIACGFLVYTLCICAKGKRKELSPILWLLDIVFIVYFVSLTII